MKVNRRLARKIYRIVFWHENEDTRPDFDLWVRNSLTREAEKLELLPGRRVKAEAFGMFLELRWQRSSEDGLPYITWFSAEPPPGEAFNPRQYEGIRFDVSRYWAALVYRLQQETEIPEEEAPLPAAGRRPSLGHYRRVLAEYDELVREGHPSPISVLVERYRARPGTVKSWLHRGRKYLKEEKS